MNTIFVRISIMLLCTAEVLGADTPCVRSRLPDIKPLIESMSADAAPKVLVQLYNDLVRKTCPQNDSTQKRFSSSRGLIDIWPLKKSLSEKDLGVLAILRTTIAYTIKNFQKHTETDLDRIVETYRPKNFEETKKRVEELINSGVICTPLMVDRLAITQNKKAEELLFEGEWERLTHLLLNPHIHVNATTLEKIFRQALDHDTPVVVAALRRQLTPGGTFAYKHEQKRDWLFYSLSRPTQNNAVIRLLKNVHAAGTAADLINAINFARTDGQKAVSIAEQLVRDFHADPLARDIDNRSPFFLSIFQQENHFTTLFAGVLGKERINETSFGGGRALHMAAMLAKKEIVQTLLKHGADPLLQDAAGKTAIQVLLPVVKACNTFDKNPAECLKILLEHVKKTTRE